MTAAGQPPERIPAGTVGKAHGLDGSFYLVGPDLRLLAKGARVLVDGETEPREIERLAGTDERPILRLSGAGDRSAVEALRGRTISIPGADAPPLDDDEYWAVDLVGCTVTGHDGRALGEVAELMSLPSCEVLVVRGERHRELLVPLVRDAVLEIDLDAKAIVVDAEFLALED